VLVTEHQYPTDPDFVSPSSLGGLYRVDGLGDAQPASLHRAYGFHPRQTFHRRYAVGTYLVDRLANERLFAVVTLDGSRPVRSFDLMAALEQQLSRAGVTGKPQAPSWIQGVAGHALLVTPLSSEEVWVADLELDSLTLTWGRLLPGLPRGQPIADEAGQLYLPLGSASTTAPQRLVALSATGEERWSVPGAGAPKAVFDGTLYVDDGWVRSTADGAQLHSWPAAGASVLLSDSRAVAVAKTGAYSIHSRVTLMERRTGAILAQKELPYTQPELVMLTDSGNVLALHHWSEPGRSSSPYAINWGLRWMVGSPGEQAGSWRQLGEYFPHVNGGIQQALLVDGYVVVREQEKGDSFWAPESRFLGFSWPDFRPPAHGWLTPTGGSAGTYAPQ
jgi:hypothetical protein